MHGQKIRIADIDTPEMHPAHCAEEQRLGDAATARFRELLNAGPVTQVVVGWDVGRYGRQCMWSNGRGVASASAGE